MKFTFTKQPHTSKINAWYDAIFIGEMFITIKEKDNIEWNKYRADKSLRMSVDERYDTNYIPCVKIAGHDSRVLGAYPSKEIAAEAMLIIHRGYGGARGQHIA